MNTTTTSSKVGGLKRGPFSTTDKKYIADYYDKRSAKEIATHLNRSFKVIKKYIRTNHASQFQEVAKVAEYNIQSSPVWKDLERQFSKEELSMFLYHWGRIISQFGEDVYPTEELQVIDTIKLEILMNRALKQQHLCMEEIITLECDLMKEKQKHPADQDRDNIYNIEKQVGILRAAQESLNSDYRDMLNRKNMILKEMKGTRDARIKVLESSKHSYVGWMQRLLSDNKLRYQLGVDMEKMRLAMDIQYEQLSEYHIYADGIADQPFLTPDNVLNDPPAIMSPEEVERINLDKEINNREENDDEK